ncbi:lipopolysaccharide assembly protein LapB [Pigmentiphaga sp. NML080357]|uniref:lipopolysaccharide assembly protein LapB n=1 Tax=Pigmentiphaga sp. NML080357 TaxID=2008675 RepID=UPI000B419172|nr:lipopolysaccharide assembly protein LapB [Pigmentiphaga sp. NML080357]OVZ64319.1 lipopolysaccharide assembly protein LapB [Pigmentiphaga sp. NML080357]
MDFEPWWLIAIPLLFGLGWVAARVDIRQMLSEHRSVPDSYFRGLNFLLNEQHDRAIDAFIEVAKLDPETIELHFALGSLFRRRGEIERAIRVHQNLLQRADLPASQREQALHALAQDYLRAGMLDRAEAAFDQLKGTRFAPDALRALVRIHETERDWPRAIQAVQALQGLIDEPVPQAVHFHCEEAAAALAAGDIEAAHAALDAAAHVSVHAERGRDDVPHVRVAMMRADLAKREGDLRAQRLHLESVLAAHPEYAGLVAEQFLANHEARGTPNEGLEKLEAHYARHPSLDLFNAIFQALRRQRGLSQAWNFARGALQRNPSLLGLDRLLEAQVAGEKSSQSAVGQQAAANVVTLNNPQADAASPWTPADDAVLMRSLIHKHTQRLDRYACQACGFKAKRFHWQCPGCNAWETYAPKRLEELDAV